MWKACASLALLLAASVSPVSAVTIDFSGEAVGDKPNGYTVEGVSFSDTVEGNLRVADFGAQSLGNGLAVLFDDASALRMTFAGPAINLILVFGNDDPFATFEGDVALLRLFLDGNQVAEASVALNRNDLADQAISINNVVFNSSLFMFADADRNPVELAEVVDNVSYTAVTSVSEPATFGLVLGGLGVLVGFARRR